VAIGRCVLLVTRTCGLSAATAAGFEHDFGAADRANRLADGFSAVDFVAATAPGSILLTIEAAANGRCSRGGPRAAVALGAGDSFLEVEETPLAHACSWSHL
jgi:hypothetical protein